MTVVSTTTLSGDLRHLKWGYKRTVMMTAAEVNMLRNQLGEFVEEFAVELGRSERRRWCCKYLG